LKVKHFLLLWVGIFVFSGFSSSFADTGENPHANLRYSDYPGNCISCHRNEAEDAFQSIHYRWMGDAPDMVNGKEVQQGKLTNSVNSYCINILGDWPVCGSCHAGKGKRPDDPLAGFENIDCLVCHNAGYAAKRTRLADGSMGVAVPDDMLVRNIHKPIRANCLSCHAKAGGGDGVKRGDISLASIDNADPEFDVHMNTGKADLVCQSCHTFRNHRVIGKGSDLRATDDPDRGAEVACTVCHTGKDSARGHSNQSIGTHVKRVACQTCHLPTYAKVATETHRDWRGHHDGTEADGISGPGHPYTEKAADLVPKYRFWNRLSENSLLGDDAGRTYDSENDLYPTSRPIGNVDDPASRLYPFKHKTAFQPKTIADNRLIAVDTLEYLKKSGDVTKSIENGLVNMGLPAGEAYEWVLTDTYGLLNHGIPPASDALKCSNCHQSTERMDLKGELGYGPKEEGGTCLQCHRSKERKPFKTIHEKHVKDKKFDCSWCHAFSRPERNLTLPGQESLSENSEDRQKRRKDR